MLRNWFILLLLIVQTLTAATGLAAEIPPKPAAGSGIYVQDYAGVLSDKAKQSILTLGNELDRKTTAQVAVVTVKTLDGAAIEDYATQLYRSWGLGTKEKNNGVLILVAVNDRKSRIEVGYGLEGVLPDGLTGRIQDQAMLPYFKQGRYADGIVNGYNTTVQLIAKDAKVQLTGVQKVAPQKQAQEREWGWSDLILVLGFAGLLLIDNLFLGGFITRMLLFSLFRGGGGRGGGGGFGGGSSGGGGSSRSW